MRGGCRFGLFEVSGGHEFEGVHAFDGVEAFEVKEGVVCRWREGGGFHSDAGEACGFVGEGVFDFFATCGVGLVGEDANFEERVGMGGGGVRVGQRSECRDDFVEGSGFGGNPEEFDGTGDEVFGERVGGVWGQGELTDTVSVRGFGEGEGDGASGVDEAMGGVGLGAVEVAECDVLELWGEGGEG